MFESPTPENAEETYKKLAELPEAVQTESMEQDIKVTLNSDVVEYSDSIALSLTFDNRLFKLVNKRSEDYDVPLAELPEPFNQREITVNLSHFPPTFKRRLSAQGVDVPALPVQTYKRECKLIKSGTSDVNVVNTEIADKVSQLSGSPFLNDDEGGLLVGKTTSAGKKLQIHESQRLDAHFVSPTPENTEETLNSLMNKELADLPENCKYLPELFNGMTNSLRLLGLHKQPPIFRNICRQVGILTGREFSYRKLAQIMFILPEAVQIEKFLLPNNEHDIKVALNFDVVEGHIEQSAYKALYNTFSNRLIKLVNKHSEVFDILEAKLPEPFNQREISIFASNLSVESSIETLPNIAEAELLNPSSLPRFSTKVVDDHNAAKMGVTSFKKQAPPSKPFERCDFCSSMGHDAEVCNRLISETSDVNMVNPKIADKGAQVHLDDGEHLVG